MAPIKASFDITVWWVSTGQSTMMAITFAIIVILFSKTLGTKAAELQQDWANRSGRRRAWDICMIVFGIGLMVATLLALGFARLWAARFLHEDAAPLEIPPSVVWSYMLTSALGVCAAVMANWYMQQGRVFVDRAARAVAAADAALIPALMRWKVLARRREMLLADWNAEQEKIRKTAFADIAEFTYGAAVANVAGHTFPAGFMEKPSEDLIPPVPLPEAGGRTPRELERYLGLRGMDVPPRQGGSVTQLFP
ncbi:MAG: hypothetical protein KF686_20165 [Ramlibacter sp.]|nr:hypothetical protein [Ramlibacter sp.]